MEIFSRVLKESVLHRFTLEFSHRRLQNLWMVEGSGADGVQQHGTSCHLL